MQLHEFTLLFLLPESWQYQSNFRMLSHDSSKTLIASCVEMSQSCPFHFNSDWSVVLVQVLCAMIFIQTTSA